MEIWKQIKDLKGYEVSSLGRVRSARKVLSPQKVGKGYLGLMIRKKQMYVHRLVATAFKPNTLGLTDVNHLNGNRQDNRAENLEWCNRRENTTHGFNTKPTTSQYIGVRFKNGKWEASIYVKPKRIYLGRYASEEQAHKAYLLALDEFKLKNKYATRY